MQSASTTLERRWEITITVLWAFKFLTDCHIISSLSQSMFEVASSKIRIVYPQEASAQAPAAVFAARNHETSSPTFASKPAFEPSTNDISLACRSAAYISFSAASGFASKRLSRIVPPKIWLFEGRKPIFRAIERSSISFIS